MMDPMKADVRTTIEELLVKRIMVLDGAMGTLIQRLHLSEAEFRGERFRHVSRDVIGDNDLLAITAPDIVTGFHHDYLAAGSDIITTDTFNSTAVSQARYGLESFAYELNVADLSRRVALNLFGAGSLSLSGADNSLPHLNDLGRPQLAFTSIALRWQYMVINPSP